MSISVNNIKVSIAGVDSNGFKIDIDGAKFRLDDFKLTQKLLSPCLLSFTLRKDPEEDISEIQFSACASIIGKDVALTLQTEEMEKQLQGGDGNGGKTADLDFEGFIVSANASRVESEYVIMVNAMSKDAAMMNSPHCRVYNEQTLDMIVLYTVRHSDLGVGGSCKMEDTIFYTTQYNESDYEFLQRQAMRYGEWMFNNGKRFFFGKLDDQEIEDIQLKYPSIDIADYSVSLRTTHIGYNQVALAYNEISHGATYHGWDQEDTGNKLNDAVFKASKENYPFTTNMIIPGNSIETDDQAEASKLDETVHSHYTRVVKQGQRANMLVYEGTTFCSKMKIGTRLTILDNYISGTTTEKSEVQQEQILITEVTHTFGVDDEYKNHFQGITAKIDYPPYFNPYVYPRCDHPVRAHVVETDDPKHWGRVKVRFPWQQKEYKDGDPDGMTPWIRVAQPYVGSDSYQFGTHLIPEKFSEVMVGFEEGNFERPYVCNALFSACHPVLGDWNPGNNNVKAIRTASGHTIEIHDTESGEDWGDGGFIKVYDDKKQVYELLLSTDGKVIRLKSKGNIELFADNDIKMEAGHNITMRAKKDNVKVNAGTDITVEAGNDYDLFAHNNIAEESANEYSAYAQANMYIETEKEMQINSDKDMYVHSKKDKQDTVDGEYRANTTKDHKIKANNWGVQANQKIKQKGQDIEINAMNGLKEYSMKHEVNANVSVAVSASATIDLKAPMIKET